MASVYIHPDDEFSFPQARILPDGRFYCSSKQPNGKVLRIVADYKLMSEAGDLGIYVPPEVTEE